MTYDPAPHYSVTGGAVVAGYASLGRELARDQRGVLAIDGPAALPWESFVEEVVAASGVVADLVDARRFVAPWDEIERRIASAALPGDAVFGRIFEGSLESLFDTLPERLDSAGLTIVFGPGSALVAHDRLWYADVPKRLALAREVALHDDVLGRGTVDLPRSGRSRRARRRRRRGARVRRRSPRAERRCSRRSGSRITRGRAASTPAPSARAVIEPL